MKRLSPEIKVPFSEKIFKVELTGRELMVIGYLSRHFEGATRIPESIMYKNELGYSIGSKLNNDLLEAFPEYTEEFELY